MGIETPEAIISDLSFKRNFTNEGGIDGTTRFLKNICGMWLLERCRKEWGDQAPAEYPKIIEEARKQPAFKSIINPDDPVFANPTNMQEAIQNYCRKSGQPVPEGYAAVARCIFDSLALRYRQVFGYLKEMASFEIDRLHVIGGGSRNELLNQFTANATGVEVLAGPQECTALGNVMLQASAAGAVKNIWDMRRVISASIDLKSYKPQDAAQWDEAFKKFVAVAGE
jgi:rhamnulokinase